MNSDRHHAVPAPLDWAFRDNQWGSVTRADCAFGAFYRRKKSQIGPAQAIVATAHMIARTVYFMLKNQVQYSPISAKSFDKRYREQQIRYLHRKATKLGFRLSPIGAPLSAVS